MNTINLNDRIGRSVKDHPSHTLVSFDVASRNFYDEEQLKKPLMKAVTSGDLGSFYVKSEGFSFRSVEGKSISLLKFSI